MQLNRNIEKYAIFITVRNKLLIGSFRVYARTAGPPIFYDKISDDKFKTQRKINKELQKGVLRMKRFIKPKPVTFFL